MSVDNDSINFKVRKKHINNLSVTIKALALTGGLYAFAFQMVPGVLSSVSNDSYAQAHASAWDEGWGTNQDYWVVSDNDAAPVSGDSCVDGSCSTASAMSSEQLKLRINQLFPEFGTNLSIRALGRGSLYEVTVIDHDTRFLVSSDGDYLITQSYFDMSKVESAADVDKLQEVNLSSSTQSSAQASSNANPASNAPDEVDPDLFRQEAFNWAMENASIKYPSLSDEVKGDIVVFADYTCPQCRAFHQDYSLVRAKGYNLHIALLSRTGSRGAVFETTNRILCSSDPKAHYEEAVMAGSRYQGRISDVDSSCQSPADEFLDMAMHFMSQEMDRPGTPGIWVNGEYFIDRNSVLSL